MDHNLELGNRMNQQLFTGEDEQFARRYEYDDGAVVAVDFGAAGETDAEVVDGTAIVIVKTTDDVQQHEIELPAEEATISTNNGVLTIEVPQ